MSKNRIPDKNSKTLLFFPCHFLFQQYEKKITILIKDLINKHSSITILSYSSFYKISQKNKGFFLQYHFNQFIYSHTPCFKMPHLFTFKLDLFPYIVNQWQMLYWFQVRDSRVWTSKGKKKDLNTFVLLITVVHNCKPINNLVTGEGALAVSVCWKEKQFTHK